jgi:anti-sigma B factor antagonist
MSVALTPHEIGNLIVIDMSGRLTILDQTFRQAVMKFLDAGRTQLVLRMSDISYIDSCGLGQLVSVYVSVKNRGGHLRLLAPSPRVSELLKITKLDTIFEILQDETPLLNASGAGSG